MMKKYITTALLIAVIACVWNTGCNKDNSNTSSTTTTRTSQFSGAQGGCANGGEKIEVLVDGKVDNAQTQYVCNGEKDTQVENASVGSTIAFGNYTGVPMQWYVLDKDTANQRIKLLAMDVLSNKYYNKDFESITWADSTIRSWLNGYGPDENKQHVDYTTDNFISAAFTAQEQSRIVSVEIQNSNNPSNDTAGGINTSDKIFLLSIHEYSGFLDKDVCAKIHCSISWWLRTPGENSYHAMVVGENGIGRLNGNPVHNQTIGVRPAMWIQY